jgi:hypothetical protein
LLRSTVDANGSFGFPEHAAVSRRRGVYADLPLRGAADPGWRYEANSVYRERSVAHKRRRALSQDATELPVRKYSCVDVCALCLEAIRDTLRTAKSDKDVISVTICVSPSFVFDGDARLAPRCIRNGRYKHARHLGSDSGKRHFIPKSKPKSGWAGCPAGTGAFPTASIMNYTIGGLGGARRAQQGCAWRDQYLRGGPRRSSGRAS